MAIQTHPYSIDDIEALKNPRAEVIADRRIRFSVDHDSYVIDLTSKNAGVFFKVMGPYIEAAEHVKPSRKSRQRRENQPAGAIREWAKDRGLEVKPSGRIPGRIVEQYRAETYQP